MSLHFDSQDMENGHEVQIKWRKSQNGYTLFGLEIACEPEKTVLFIFFLFVFRGRKTISKNINFRWSESIKRPTGDKMSSGNFPRSCMLLSFFSAHHFCTRCMFLSCCCCCFFLQKSQCIYRENIGLLAGWFRFYSQRFTHHFPFTFRDIHFYRYMSFFLYTPLCILGRCAHTYSISKTPFGTLFFILSSFCSVPLLVCLPQMCVQFSLCAVYWFGSVRLGGGVVPTDNPIMKLFFWLLIPIWYWVSLPFRQSKEEEEIT